jgi:hypothetical protein
MSFIQRIRESARPCVTFRNIVFYCKELLAPRPTPKMEDLPSSALRDCLVSIFAVTFHILRTSPSASRGCAMPWWQRPQLIWGHRVIKVGNISLKLIGPTGKSGNIWWVGHYVNTLIRRSWGLVSWQIVVEISEEPTARTHAITWRISTVFVFTVLRIPNRTILCQEGWLPEVRSSYTINQLLNMEKTVACGHKHGLFRVERQIAFGHVSVGVRKQTLLCSNLGLSACITPLIPVKLRVTHKSVSHEYGWKCLDREQTILS